MGNHTGARRHDPPLRRHSRAARGGLIGDIVLRCAPRRWRGGIGLSITEPASSGARKGLLDKPPKEWSVAHSYYEGESNLQPLIAWLHKSLGVETVGAIWKIAREAPTRLLITDDKAPAQMLGTPWEVLEETNADLQLMGNLHVVRSLPLPSRSGGADDIGASLRVLVTWADPTGNIPALEEHLRWLAALPEESDNAVAIEVVEFTNVNVVRDAAHNFHPNVIYHFGHAEQIGGDKVSLRIGASGQRQQFDGALYAELLRPFSPRILVLNACSTITGSSLSPYIGMSSECMAACESVVCMQTEVPVGAAKRFGEALLKELADGAPVSRAVRLGRMAIACESAAPFTKFIPVLFTRGRSDPAFDVEADQRDRLRIRKRIEVDLQKVKPFLARDADAAVDTLLANGTGVALITGPASSGKSTTVRGRIKELFRTSETARVLYLSVGQEPWDATHAHRVRQILNKLATHYGWLTQSLKATFGERSDVDASQTVADLAAWLTEQARSNRRTVLVVDDVPDEVASELATLAANVVNDGLLVVIARAANVDLQLGVTRIDVPFMTDAEIGTPGVLARTGGMPFFVASIARRQPLDGSRLDSRLAAVPESALHALRLAAHATVPLPRAWLESIGGAADMESLATDHLLIESESRARLTLPDVVRERVLAKHPGDARALHDELFAFFDTASKETANGPVERELAQSAALEAMRQALALAKQTNSEDWLKRARGIAVELHGTAMMEAGDPVAAKGVWDSYREVASELGEFNEREVDSRFAEALAGVGEVKLADDLLDAVIAEAELDDLHVSTLILRSNVLKRLGEHGTFAERVHLLQQAEALAERLIEENPEDVELRAMLGNVEHSLGNAFGYGAHARIPDAERHVKRAAEIFDALGDLRGHRARAELIEIRRYNGLLSDAECTEAIETIRRQAKELVTPSMQRDAVGHLYELGRLEKDPEARARWFRRAHERADGAFSPLDLHAALQWRLAELEIGKDVEPELKEVLKMLERFAEDSWSLRLRRDALRVLAKRAFDRGEPAAGTERLREALAIVRLFQKKGEGRHDAEVRAALENEGGHYGLRG